MYPFLLLKQRGSAAYRQVKKLEKFKEAVRIDDRLNIYVTYNPVTIEDMGLIIDLV